MNRTTAAQRTNARYDKIWARYEAQKEAEMTHTPGPWEFGGNFGPKDDVEVWSKADLVAMVSNQTELDTLLANARLIAAAPALLEALEALSTQVADACAEYNSVLATAPASRIRDAARDAIALARGEEVTA